MTNQSHGHGLFHIYPIRARRSIFTSDEDYSLSFIGPESSDWDLGSVFPVVGDGGLEDIDIYFDE
jgi:hypothetical protein